jgi:hypothetical protein
MSLVGDAQERACYRAQTFIRDSIRGFQPSATQLQYPQILEQFYGVETDSDINGLENEGKERTSSGSHSSLVVKGSLGAITEVAEPEAKAEVVGDGPIGVGEGQPTMRDVGEKSLLNQGHRSEYSPAADSGQGSVYSTWYPPLESTLMCLAKMYRCVNSNIFNDLAQVESCQFAPV